MASKYFSQLLALLVLAVATPIHAQYQASDPVGVVGTVARSDSADPLRNIEISTSAQHLSNDYGDWRDVTLRGNYEVGPNVWQTELASKREFGLDGSYLGLSDTVTLSTDWFATLSIGAGDGAFYLPQFRADAFIYRKWLEKRNLITSFGTGYYRAPDGHTDRSLSLGAAYYFTDPWILEVGVRYNFSDPGAVRSNQQFVAATYGVVGHDVLTARYGWGGEGYQAIASNLSLVNFDSRQASISWRHWFNRRSGVLVAAEQYTNPSYQRQGLTVGLFHQF
jgi:YaiO family outer membrane protein